MEAKDTEESEEIECEEGCGCKFERRNAFVSAIDGMEHFFCCANCADEFRKALDTETSEIIRECVRGGFTVVDIGCGSGYYLSEMIKASGPNGKVIGIDSNPEIIRDLSNGQFSQANVELHVASASDVGFIATNSVDFVLSNNVLCCMEERTRAAREISRILSRDGCAYIRVSMNEVRGIRKMTEDEWSSILSMFDIIRRGTSGGLRWALVKKKINSHT